MRKAVAAIFFSLVPFSISHAAPEAPPATRLAKVGFTQDIGIAGMQKLLGGSGNRLFVARQKGVVDIVTVGKDGKHTTVALQAKARKGEATLSQPEAAVAANGVIYVVDSDLNRVAMFGDDGKFRGSFGHKGGDPDELRAPRGIAWQDGILYVADTGNGRIQRYGDNGVYLGALEVADNPANKPCKDKDIACTLDKPVDVAVDAQGQVYVLDAGGSFFGGTPTIKVYSAAGVYLRQFPQNGKAAALAMADDALYVADQAGFAVQKYDLSGTLQSFFGSRGDGRAQFKSLAGLLADGGRMFIGDSERGAVHEFSTEAGAPAGERPLAAAAPFVRLREAYAAAAGKMAWNGKDTLYAIASDGSGIMRLHNGTAQGKLKLKDITAVALAVDRTGALWVLDQGAMRVVKLDDAGNVAETFGARGSQRGQFSNASAIALSSTGNIFVADPGNRRVQVFSSDGVLVDVITRGAKASLSRPTALALDPQDNLYVLDADRDTVSAYSPALDPLADFGQGDPFAAHNLKDAVDLAATHTEVMVLGPERVQVYSLAGTYVRTFGAPGEDAGEFDEPSAIALTDASTVAIADKGNKRVQVFTTLYKPAAPEQLMAEGVAHAVRLHWAPSPLPYVSQYDVYRAASDQGPFVRIGSSKTDAYLDDNLAPEQSYYYVVASRSGAGHEGLPSYAVKGMTQKYIPPALANVQVTPGPEQLKLRWDPLDARFVNAYIVYQKAGDVYLKLGETATPEFTRTGLTPGTAYTLFLSTRSVDGIESGKQPVQASTTVDTSAPVEFSAVDLHDVFSNTYKVYEDEGIGTIKLRNNTNTAKKDIKVSFVLNNFMDYPTETKVDTLAPGETKEVTLKAVFNNTILTLTEDTPVQAKLEASYFENGQQKAFSKIRTITVYDKHRLLWNDANRYAAFITPKDPVILNFTRSVASQFSTVKDPTQLAAAVFDTLGALGVTYVQDPTNPYQVSSRKVDTVDYIEYPREAISRKSGDCDDLVALYSASLEALGIPTRALLLPGHMLMMFNTGIIADADNYTMDNMYVLHDGTLWIPVETTLIGKAFTKAWESGADTYYKAKSKDLVVFDPHDAWKEYKPATLPDETWQPAEKTRADVDKAFPGDSTSVLKISSQTQTRRYLQAIQQNPRDMNAYLQIGIIMAKAGDHDEAMKYFDTVLDAEPRNAAALNNKANLHMLNGQYPSAQKLYLAASQADPRDAEVLVNLAKAYMAGKKVKDAKSAFGRARRLDPSVADRYKALALELQGTLSPGKKHHTTRRKEKS